MHSRWESIIQIALRTPSPHNTQPWRLRIKDDRRATLYLEVARTLPDEDTTGHFLRHCKNIMQKSSYKDTPPPIFDLSLSDIIGHETSPRSIPHSGHSSRFFRVRPEPLVFS